MRDAPLEELIENIDIGGPTMIRAAAKNCQDVAVVTSPDDYAAIIEELRASGSSCSRETHWSLAKQAFATTAAYDRAVSPRSAEIPPTGDPLPAMLDIRAPRKARAALRRKSASIGGALCDRQCRNRRRRAASWQGAFLQQSGRSGRRLAVDRRVRRAGVGHHQAHQSVRLRGSGDAGRKLPPRASKPIRFRPTVECWRSIASVDGETAAEIAKMFIEAIAAPGYSEEALRILGAKRNLRLLRVTAAAARNWWSNRSAEGFWRRRRTSIAYPARRRR